MQMSFQTAASWPTVYANVVNVRAAIQIHETYYDVVLKFF